MVFSNHASNQDSNRNDNNSHQNKKANKEGMRLRWTSMIQYPSDDKNNPAEAGLLLLHKCISRLSPGDDAVVGGLA
jgi:hypothetical protein|nr:MAG TPA: hypothetical protein [Caudoviricetes sp.]